jgi:beta-glucosidase
MKKNNSFSILLLTGLLLLCLIACKQTGPTLGQTPIDKIIAGMTLKEKANLVVGMGTHFEIPDSILKLFPAGMIPPPIDTTKDTIRYLVVGNTPDFVPGAAGTTANIKRFGITPLVLTDGPAGLRIQPIRKNDSLTYYCTAFPVATVLASTWDTALVTKVGQAIGNEVHEYGADILLAPALNIHRNPLCGRNFEYYSEDPLIAGKIAAAMVKGVQSQGVGTSIKHFAGNNQETNRNTVNTIVSERALREIYLEGFRIAVQDANPWTVMSSYNKINGTYTSQSNDLITKILRDDWGFKGFVMTDWGGGNDPVAQMKAGNDLLEPGSIDQVKTIIQAVKDGQLDEKILDKNIGRILSIILQSPRFLNYRYSNKPDLKLHAEITRQAATDGMVLLKNDKEALPLAVGVKKIAAFGNTSYEIIKGGTGSGNVNAAYSIPLTIGLKNAGFILDESLQKTYESYIQDTRAKLPKSKNPFDVMMGVKPAIAEMKVDSKLLAKMANDDDVAIITIGRNAGEGADRHVDGDFNLTENEKSVIKSVSQAFQAKGKKAIVILNIGGVIEVASWRAYPDAILLAWQPGQEAGNSITDVISGKVNPSGKLASTFPISYNDVPSAKNFPGIELPDTAKIKNVDPFNNGKPSEVVYEEDIYVGYRYYSTFQIPVAYEFGYGLSYTQFEFSNIKISGPEFKDNLSITLDIKNTGKVEGKEVVQLYLTAPGLTLNKPSEELKGFAKTKLLKPGEVQTVSFMISGKDLASFDTPTSSWVAEPGVYKVNIGASSKDIRQTVSFQLPQQLVVQKVSKALAPTREIKLLKPKK